MGYRVKNSTTVGHTPEHKAFGGDKILSTKELVDWNKITQIKKAANNHYERELNKTRSEHEYTLCDEKIIIIQKERGTHKLYYY